MGEELARSWTKEIWDKLKNEGVAKQKVPERKNSVRLSGKKK